MSTSDDEFDNLPDDLCQVEGVDWDQILPVLPLFSTDPSQDSFQRAAIAARSSFSTDSSQYSCDDDDLDPTFFAELDNLEKDIVQSQQGSSRIALNGRACSLEHSLIAQGNDGTSPSELRNSDSVHSTSLSGNIRQPIASSSSSSRPKSRKRARESSPLNAPDKKGKGKAENKDVWQVLSGIEDELTCPICSDIFVAAHVCNPCGHSICGECGWQWKRKGKTNCAICRTELARDMPLIPNFAMDNTIEKHIAALGHSGISEWKISGSKHIEWLGRKEQWKKGAVERTKAKVPERQSNQAIIVWEILDEDELDEIDYDDFDSGSRLVRSRRRRVR
ncbi:hypothetical protein E4T56_gene3567 [Termitomyces sp. T112]|nr:hypothetical protein E4T56_gene3567 [Termitomyces sp. T112]